MKSFLLLSLLLTFGNVNAKSNLSSPVNELTGSFEPATSTHIVQNIKFDGWTLVGTYNLNENFRLPASIHETVEPTYVNEITGTFQ